MTERSGRRRAGREGGGRDARREARANAVAKTTPFIERKIPYMEYMDEESLQIIEDNADIILEEIGIDFLDDSEALEMLATRKRKTKFGNYKMKPIFNSDYYWNTSIDWSGSYQANPTNKSDYAIGYIDGTTGGTIGINWSNL